jgi:hypothetical protein
MKNSLIVLTAFLLAINCTYATSTATRVLPDTAYPGTNFTVTILLDFG